MMVEAVTPSPDKLLADLKHRLRTPLTHIIGYSQLILDDVNPDQTDVVEHLRTVDSSAMAILARIQADLSSEGDGTFSEKNDRLRGGIAEPLDLIIGAIAIVTARLKGEVLRDVLRINIACANLLSFVRGQDQLEKQIAAVIAPSETMHEPARMPRSRVLIVDDNDANRDMLSRQLVAYGHTPVCHQNGESALDALGEQAFDLVLLDVMMPGMNGIEVLRRIKLDPLLADVPVIMISALDEQERAARCIEMGADDYLLKPFNTVLLRARLSSALERKRLSAQEKARTRELERASKDLERANEDLHSFSVAASHDLQEPLRTVAVTLQVLRQQATTQLTQAEQELIDLAVDGAHRMGNLIADLLAYSLANSSDRVMEKIALDSALDDALTNLRQSMEESGAKITHDALPSIMADRAQSVQLFQNLIGNAIKYCSNRTPEVHIGATQRADGWVIFVRDNGLGIEPQYQEMIFQPFRRLHGASLPGTGLGLAICKRIVEGGGGKIWVESRSGHGSIFYFEVGGPTISNYGTI